MKPVRGFDIRGRRGFLGGVLALGLAANLVVIFLVNLPRAHRAESLRAAAERFGHVRTERERTANGLRGEYQRIMDGRRTLETFYSDVLSTKRERMTAVQREIREIARKYNIAPETITYNHEPFERDRITRFTVVMPLDGSYENLRQFISSVENSENFLTITGILLADSKEGGVILSLNVTLATWFFDPDIVQRKKVVG